VNESTIRRWLKLAHVDAAYQEAKDDLYHRVLVSLQKRSMATLEKHITAPVEVTAASQVKAVALVFEQAMFNERARELEARFDELELLLKGAGLNGHTF